MVRRRSVARRRRAAGLLAVGLLVGAVPGAADEPLVDIPAPAVVTEPAVALAPLPVDLVSIFQTGEMTSAVRDAALSAARAAGAPATVGRGFTIGLKRVRRGTAIVQEASSPVCRFTASPGLPKSCWVFPMSVTALPVDVIGATMGRAVSGPISAGQVVMGETSAALRGAQAGDTVDLVGLTGTMVTFTIGRVAPDSEVGGAEIVMSFEQADLLGATRTTRVLVYGLPSRASLDEMLAAYGVSTNTKVRVRRSWDAFDPDLTMGMARTKELLGEFDFDLANLDANGWTNMNPAWAATNLPSVDTYPTGVRARCHVAIKAALTAALQQIATQYPSLVNNPSITSDIDVANTNLYGGCGTGRVRFARITQNLGSISRHSWGQPIDMSTVANCQGCVPRFDCRIVRVFRAHGFAWGGNFLTPDGMHFEWVGEPRHTYAYPSKYCPNLPSGQIESLRPSPSSRDTFFADDGWALDAEHDH